MSNSLPVFTGLDGTPTYIEGGAAQILDANVTIGDVELDALNGGDGQYDGASLSLVRNGGANSQDIFSLVSGGNLTVAGGPDGGGTISAGGQIIAQIANTGATGQLQIAFEDNTVVPSRALVNEVMQAIRYSNNSNDPAATVQINWTFSDGNSGNAQGTGANPGTTSGSVTVSNTNVSDAPILSANGGNPTFTEGGGAQDLFNTVSASTVEAADRIDAMTLTVTNVGDGASEILRVDGSDVALTDGNSVTTATNGLGVTVGVVGTTATVSFSGATLTGAQFQTLIDGMTYRNTSEDPTTAGNRVVTVTNISDTGSTANGGVNTASPNIVSTVTVVGVNDPPIIGNVDGETSPIIVGLINDIIGFNDATVVNPDSADYNGGFLFIDFTASNPSGDFGFDGITVRAGGNTLGRIANNDFVEVSGVIIGTIGSFSEDGQNGNALQINFNSANATSAAIETLIQNLTYEAPTGLLGPVLVDMSLVDGDGTANGGNQRGSANFTLNLTPPPPVLSNIAGDTVTVDMLTSTLIDQGSNVSITDSDSANFNGGNLTLARTGTVLDGDFSLAAGVTSNGDATLAAGQTIAVGGTNIGTVTTDGQGTNNLVITFNTADATPANVQTLIQALTYTPNTTGTTGLGTQGTHSFDLTLTDAAVTPATSDAAAISVVANFINQAPSVTSVATAANFAENGTGTVYTVTGNDPDSFPTPATLTYAISGGADAALFDIDGSTGAVTFTNAPDFEAPADAGANNVYNIEVTTSDGSQTSTAQAVTITVTDVANDERPAIANLNGDSVTGEPNQALRLDQGTAVTVTDLDSANFNGGNLTIIRSGGLLGDLATSGSITAGTDTVIAVGETINVNGTTIGTVSSDGQGGSELGIDFNAAATPAQVAQLLQNLTIKHGSDTSGGLDITITDGTGPSALTSVNVNISTPPPPPAPTPPTPPTDGGSFTPVAVTSNDPNLETSTTTENGFTTTNFGNTGGDFLEFVAGNLFGFLPPGLFGGISQGGIDVCNGGGCEGFDKDGYFYVPDENSQPQTLLDPPVAVFFDPSTLGNQEPGDEGAPVITIGPGDTEARSERVNIVEYSPTKGSDEPVETGIGFLAFNPSTGSNPGVFDNVINMFGFGSLTGGAGNNFATGDGAAQTIILGPGDDTTFGGAGDDSVGSTTGDDVIYGNQGNDTVFGGQDDDRLFGGADQDAVYGNQGADTLFGNIGTDTGFGGQGDDVIYGNQGDDQLSGNRGNDLLFGGQGNDVLQGQGGDDVLFGGQGGDRFTFVSDPQGADLGRDVIRDYNAAAGDVIAGSVFSASSTTTLEDGSLRLSAEDGSSVLVIGITDISQLVFG